MATPTIDYLRIDWSQVVETTPVNDGYPKLQSNLSNTSTPILSLSLSLSLRLNCRWASMDFQVRGGGGGGGAKGGANQKVEDNPSPVCFKFPFGSI